MKAYWIVILGTLVISGAVFAYTKSGSAMQKVSNNYKEASAIDGGYEQLMQRCDALKSKSKRMNCYTRVESEFNSAKGFE